MACGCQGQKWTPPADRKAAKTQTATPSSQPRAGGVLGKTWNGPKAKSA